MAARLPSALLRRAGGQWMRSAVPMRSPIAVNAWAVRGFAAAAQGAASTTSKPDMFCFQCEQTEKGTGCTTVGVCGKTAGTAKIQDALLYALKGLGMYAHAARQAGCEENPAANRATVRNLFATLTNVNFDEARFPDMIAETIQLRDERRGAYEGKLSNQGMRPRPLTGAAAWHPEEWTQQYFEAFGEDVGVLAGRDVLGADLSGLHELIMYGLKGTGAYAAHALELDQESTEVYAGIHSALALLGTPEADVGKLVATALGVGGTNVKTLALLSEGHSGRYGDPVPTEVNHSPVPGKCILISGHDMRELEALLEQTAGKGINVYTHGEMLPAHGYPGLKNKFPHLVGNYGAAWQLQRFEFAKFPGPIVMTTNCLMEPRDNYKDHIFTVGPTGWPGVSHIENRDFSKVIAKAQSMDGFTKALPPKTTMVGFGHKAVLGAAPAVLQAVSDGRLKRIVLIGGCDGSESERNYYTKLATSLPDQAAILTLGCGKYRLLGKKDYGTIPGTPIPRLLDMGQCNDSYSAVVVALELAKVLKTDVNSLPLSIVLSWFEQKAVAVLLSLLHLGVKNIRIGPNLPAFVTPPTLKLLVDNFNLMAVHPDQAEADARTISGM